MAAAMNVEVEENGVAECICSCNFETHVCKVLKAHVAQNHGDSRQIWICRDCNKETEPCKQCYDHSHFEPGFRTLNM